MAIQSRSASFMASFRVLRPGFDDAHLRAEELHPEDVEALSPHVLRTHEDLAAQAEQRRHRGGGDAVLSGAGLGDQACLAEAARNQRLPDGVVHLVRAGVQQILALEVDARAAESLGEPASEVEPRRAAGVVAQPALELAAEARRRGGASSTPRSSSSSAGMSVSAT